jgi:hypothetical protein
MAQNCTILCPIDDPRQVLAVVRDFLPDGADIGVNGNDSEWTRIEIKTGSASLTLNRQVRHEPGDRFSRMVLGMHNYFRVVKTPSDATQRDVLDRVASMALAIGVVAEPQFIDEARHYDCIFGIAAAMNAIVWTGSGVINADGIMILDGDGNSDVG